MKPRLPYPLFSAICLLFSTLLFSQDENYDAVYLQLTKIYTLNADGSMDYNYVKKIKLQTYRAFNNLYGETFIIYNPEFQSLKINDVYTIMADGKKVSSPKNAFNEVLPGFASGAPAYNNMREMVITHPGTERNAILCLDYTLHSKKGFYPALMGNEVLAESEPLKELTVKIRVPLTVKLNYKILNSNASPEEFEEEGFRVCSWKFRDVPAISPEEFQKGGFDLYPRLIFSTAKDRGVVYGSFKQSFSAVQPSEEIKKTAEAILKECKEETDVILKLQEKVVNEFRLWPVPLKYTGFTCRPAAETWKSNGGNLAEKAILLISLLNEAGFSAEPVLVMRNSLFDEKIGSLLDIEDIIVKVIPKSTDILYLSVSSLNPQNLIYGLPERVFVSLDRQKDPENFRTPEDENKITFTAMLNINEKKQFNGEVSATFLNNCDPWLAILRDKTKMKSYFGGFSATDLKEQKVITTGPDKSYSRYVVEKEKPLHKDTNFYFYSLPFVTNGIDSWGIKLLPKTRITPFEIPSIMEESYDLAYTLPDGMKLFTAVNKTEIRNKAGFFLFEVKSEGDKVMVNKTIKLEKRVIEPSLYTDFKALMDRWNTEKFKEIIFIE